MRLSPHFTIEEFETSQTAARHGIDNRIPANLMPNIRMLVDTLERARAILGNHPIMISSGYRCAHLNRLVGGARASHHLYGAAADFTCRGFGEPLVVCEALAPHLNDLAIGQLIHEYGRWAHLSVLAVARNSRIITIDAQGTRVGLHPARS